MKIQNAQLLKLCEQHIQRFKSLLEGLAPNVRVAECQHYLEIWERGRDWTKSCPEGEFQTEEALKHDLEFRGEVLDAYGSGEFEQYFTDDTEGVQTTFDESSNVLYVKLSNATNIKVSQEATGDDLLILNLSEDQEIVGIQILEAGDLLLEEWEEHPIRSTLPAPLYKAVENWLVGVKS